MAKHEIDPQIIREMFLYDPSTGKLTWAVDRNGKRRPGDEAGYCQDGYRMVEILKHGYGVHVIIWVWMTGKWPKHRIDHINTKPDDNRWVNLREATNAQNKANCPPYRTNKLGVKGVFRAGKKFRVQIQVDGRRKDFGTYDTLEEAAEVSKAAHAETWGEFTRH